jgi:NADH-quinone oxidoreductase subunit J
MGSPIVFLILAAIAIFAAMGMLLSRNAIHSALFLILVMATIAVFYLVLNAPFIAMVQVAVYAGAIMVLFLFVIMLLGAEQLQGARGGLGWQSGLALALAVALVVSFGFVLFGSSSGAEATAPAIDAGPTAIGLKLFESYVFPFEITSVLLLVAMVGVVVMRTRKRARKNA